MLLWEILVMKVYPEACLGNQRTAELWMEGTLGGLSSTRNL
jgi:hypothetical protein